MGDGIGVKVDLKNLKNIEKMLTSLSKSGRSLQPVLQKLGTAMVGIVDRNFEAEGRPIKWKKRVALSQANLAVGAQNRAKKTKHYDKAKAKGRASILRRTSLKMMGNKILSQSGDLKKSITFVADNTRVIVGPGGGVPYARIHQLGGVIVPKRAKALAVPCGMRILRLKSVRMPARPYLAVPQSEVPKLSRLAADSIENLIRQEVLRF